MFKIFLCDSVEYVMNWDGHGFVNHLSTILSTTVHQFAVESEQSVEALY